MAAIILTAPGLFSSGPEHWQTHWENKYGFTRIQQQNWETPVCDDWTRTIDEAVDKLPMEEVVLIGHSLACSTIVRWADKYKRVIKGAMLVGPSDVEAASYPPGTTGFHPMPVNRLPFPSLVIASSNDEYVSMERARYFASQWGSGFIDAGPLGHINSSSGIGEWPEGIKYLQTLL